MIRIVPRALVLLGLAFSFPVLVPRSAPGAEAAPVSTATMLTRAEKIRRIEALDAARRRALAGIYDERLYPEADHGRSGQPEIDRRVNRVKALFAPLDPLLEAEAVRLAHEPAAKRNAFLARKEARLDAWSRAVKPLPRSEDRPRERGDGARGELAAAPSRADRARGRAGPRDEPLPDAHGPRGAQDRHAPRPLGARSHGRDDRAPLLRARLARRAQQDADRSLRERRALARSR